MAGDAKFDASQIVPDFPYAQYAESIGLRGISVETCDRVAAGWEEALAARKPVVIEFHTDPEVPPLPPHITREQAQNFMKSLLHDPNRAQIIKDSMKEMFAAFKS